MDLSELLADLAAFADDEDDVVIEANGSFVMTRGERDISGRIVERPDGGLFVESNNTSVPYRTFLMNDLAHFDLFAERLLSRRPPVTHFVDGPVEVTRAAEATERSLALAAVRDECERVPPFSAQVSFVTADAGHGKTALLREFQTQQAQKYARGQADFLFWHLDLQGRQLLRLSEALMGDLGDLRISGLWMPAIVRLMKRRALVLAIDGFDELAAEQGSTDALGALAALVARLEGRGCVLAAARRTFFDTDDYLRKAGMIGRGLEHACQFNQVSLLPWGAAEGIEYITRVRNMSGGLGDPPTVYAEIAAELGNAIDHPMLTRPFLLAQIVKAVGLYGLTPAQFLHNVDDLRSGVAAVVQAFVAREVADKWKFRDTGEPYLTQDQHMELLSDVAEEMYRSQKERLDIDVIETLATLLLDQWAIDLGRQQQVLEMVRMHVLLVPDSDNARMRAFDHPEFRDYFIAYALKAHLERVMEGEEVGPLARFLSIAQLSDSVARYVCGMLDMEEGRVRRLLAGLETIVATEWKPTFVQINMGTLLPFILSNHRFGTALEFSGNIVISSLAFEGSDLANVVIEGASFVNVSLEGCNWNGVTLARCNLGELALGSNSAFHEVIFRDCEIEGLRIQAEDEEIREYAPDRIWSRLSGLGIMAPQQGSLLQVTAVDPEEGETARILRRFLRLFSRTTVITDHQIKARFRQDHSVVFEAVLPLLEQHGVVSQKKWKGAGSAQVWGLNERMDDLLAAEGSLSGPSRLTSFWADVANL